MSEATEGTGLSGREILLIAIPRSATREAHFFAGKAECDGDGIGIRAERGAFPPIHAPRPALRGFSPTVLPRFVVPEHHAKLGALLKAVESCVIVFADEVPKGGLVLYDAFYGLATGASGEPLIMEGGDE